MKKILNEGNQTHNFMSSSGFGPVINYGSGSDFLTNYGSGSTSQNVTVPTVPVPQHWPTDIRRLRGSDATPFICRRGDQIRATIGRGP